MGKNPDEAFEFFDTISESSQMYDLASPNIVETKTSTSQRGKYVLEEDDDMRATMATLYQQLEALGMKKVNEVSDVSPIDQLCRVCALLGHPTGECPTIPACKEVLME